MVADVSCAWSQTARAIAEAGPLILLVQFRLRGCCFQNHRRRTDIIAADRGVVAIDGIDLRTVTISSLRRKIAFVPQDPFLFRTTLAENLRFARLDASNEEMLAACTRARLDQVVASLPLGLPRPPFGMPSPS